MEKGYKIIETYEVYEHQVTQYNLETDEIGIFVDYINVFLKLKAEASGYPGWVQRPQCEKRYIQSFLESEGITLEKESNKYNAEKRSLAKFCLYFMWGKLTERSNRKHTKLVSEPKDLYRLLAMPGIEVINLMFANDDVVCVSWKFTAEEWVPIPRRTNDVNGAYVTAGARMVPLQPSSVLALLILQLRFRAKPPGPQEAGFIILKKQVMGPKTPKKQVVSKSPRPKVLSASRS